MSVAAKNQVEIVSGSVGVQNFNFYTTIENEPSQKRYPFSFGIPNAVSSFYGREEEVEELDRLFDKNKIVAVHGLGGYGKTQLACHYAGLRREKYDGNLVWIKGEVEDYLKGSFRDVALDLQIPNCKDREIKSVIQEVYNYFEGTRVLFIIDNAEDNRSILEFLPQSFKLKDAEVNVLITSQCTTWGNIPGLPLKELSLEYALQVLSAIMGKDKFSSIPKDEWKQLAEAFDCIPLGLQIAGGYVKQRLSSNNLSNDFSIKRYIARIEENNMLLEKKLPADSDSSYEKSIYSSLYFTVKKIEASDGEESKCALDLINICAHLDPGDISDKLLQKSSVIGDSLDKLEEALCVLEQYSLIVNKEPVNFMFMGIFIFINVHRLVQMFFRYHQEKSGTVVKYYKEALYTVTNTFSHWRHGPCAYVLANSNNLKMLLESLTSFTEKKMVIKEWKLLHLASRAVLPDVMQLLLEHGADVNSSSVGAKDTPLCILTDNSDHLDAAQRDRWEEAVRLLVEHNANTAVRDFSDKTILHSAATWRCPALIHLILDQRQLDPDVRDKLGCAPLHWVTREEISDEAEMSRAEECVRVLVTRNANINAKDFEGRSVLHYTAILGNWPLTQVLVDRYGMDPNARDNLGNTPLLLVYDTVAFPSHAQILRAQKVVGTLAKRGALLDARNTNGTGILHLAARKKCSALLRYLIDNYSLDVDTRDKNYHTPLHLLARSCSRTEEKIEETKELVDSLVQKGANMNATDSEGVPPLSFAASLRNAALVAYFLREHPVDVNHQDNAGKTPLFWTVHTEILNDTDQERAETIIKLLISKDANLRLKDQKGRTILHECALKLNSRLLEFFIDDHHLDPDEQDDDGFTALHFVANVHPMNEKFKKMALTCMEVLQSRGVRQDLVNNEGWTPAQLSVKSGNFYLTPFFQ